MCTPAPRRCRPRFLSSSAAIIAPVVAVPRNAAMAGIRCSPLRSNTPPVAPTSKRSGPRSDSANRSCSRTRVPRPELCSMPVNPRAPVSYADLPDIPDDYDCATISTRPTVEPTSSAHPTARIGYRSLCGGRCRASRAALLDRRPVDGHCRRDRAVPPLRGACRARLRSVTLRDALTTSAPRSYEQSGRGGDRAGGGRGCQSPASTGQPCTVPLRHDWTPAEIETIIAQPFHDLLRQAQATHRERFDPHAVEGAMLLSIKTGACPEDCAYCPQSAHYRPGSSPSG